MKWTEERISEVEDREIPNLNRKQTEKKKKSTEPQRPVEL